MRIGVRPYDSKFFELEPAIGNVTRAIPWSLLTVSLQCALTEFSLMASTMGYLVALAQRIEGRGVIHCGHGDKVCRAVPLALVSDDCFSAAWPAAMT